MAAAPTLENAARLVQAFQLARAHAEQRAALARSIAATEAQTVAAAAPYNFPGSELRNEMMAMVDQVRQAAREAQIAAEAAVDVVSSLREAAAHISVEYPDHAAILAPMLAVPAPAPAPAPAPMPAHAAAPVVPLAQRNIPEGSNNTITMNAIHNGNEMVNFHNEYAVGRYYKRHTYNMLPNPKINPYSRAHIANPARYIAHVVPPPEPAAHANANAAAPRRRKINNRRTRRRQRRLM